MSDTSPSRIDRVLDALRWLGSLASIGTLTTWGFVAFDFPFPAILSGIGVFVLAVVSWALVLSPRPVIRVDAFGTALAEIVLCSTAGFAAVSLGWPWLIAVLLVATTAVPGVIAGWRSLGSSAR